MFTIEEFDVRAEKLKLDVRCITDYYATRLKPLFSDYAYQLVRLIHAKDGYAELQWDYKFPADILNEIKAAFHKHFDQ